MTACSIASSLAILVCAASCLACHPIAAEHHEAEGHGSPERAEATPEESKPVVTDLLKTPLEVWTEGEVIVSHFDVPPGFELAKHHHPGEEFIYVLEGSAVVWQQDKPEVVLKKGDVFKIPFGQVHTAITRDVGAKGLVFRVHQKGQPPRVDVE